MVLYGTLVNILGRADMGDSSPVRGVVRTTTGDVEAYVKPVHDSTRLAAEVFSFLLARAAGIPVPAAIVVSIPPHFGPAKIGFGSRALGHPNLYQGMATVTSTMKSSLRAWPKVMDAVCFDEWIGNSDRHPGNLISDGRGNFWLIDHDKAMLTSHLSPDALSRYNQLFTAIDSGKFDLQREEDRRKAESVMASLETIALSTTLGPAGQLATAPGVPELVTWLGTRQSHLLKLGCQRVPVPQLGIFP